MPILLNEQTPRCHLVLLTWLDTRRGEVIMGFNLRSGLWIDGIEILTSLGRRSGMYGNPTGGSG